MSRVLVVEADGGSRGNPGPAGYGAVVRDRTSGEVLAETAEYLGRATNNVAEYRGLIAGLRAAREIDPQARIEVRMDSKLVVEQMSGRWKVKHPDMVPLAAEARTLVAEGQVTFGWIPREKNKHADRLANEAMDAGKAGKRWQARQAPAAGTGTPAPAGGATASGAGSASAARSAPAAPEAEAVKAPAAPAPAAPPDTGPGTTLLMLRHGETALTPEKRFSGSGGSDPELSEKGRWQAGRAAESLAARGVVEAVVASPLRRCRETAEAVAARLGLPVRVEEGLREASFGEWDGLTFQQVMERWPAELDAWLESETAAPPGGESLVQVGRRVAVARDKVLARHPGRTVLLVTHVTPIKTLVRMALGAPADAMHRMQLAAASLTTVQQFADGGAVLRVFNETAHLR